MKKPFLLGVQGRPWNDEEIASWRSSVLANGKVRDYGQIAARLQALPNNIHTVQSYGEYTVGNDHYSPLCVTTGDLKNGKPSLLLDAGVHGYEPSGIEAIVRFLEKDAPTLSRDFNFVAYPCISPWAYEYDERWNYNALDPNRQFAWDRDIIETCLFMESIEQRAAQFAAAVDQHETNDRDIGLRQMRAERFNDKLAKDYEHIPQGFYLTTSKGDTEEADQRQILFGTAIMDRVRKVSPVAPDAEILGYQNHNGILLADKKPGFMRTYLGNFTEYVGVTEVYPDHPDMDFEKSVQTQLASIHGAMDFVLGR